MKVVCINDHWQGDPCIIDPVKNEIYTIVEVIENPKINNTIQEGVFFVLAGLNGLYDSDCFRLIDNSFGEKMCAEIEWKCEPVPS